MSQMNIKSVQKIGACGFGFAVLQLTHSFLTAKHLFPGFFTFFYAIFKFLKPEYDCYAKFTSCST